MPNKNGSVYGLTILSPIKSGSKAEVSYNLALRMYLAKLPRHDGSPFAKVSSTHLARLVVMDDVIYVGMPTCEEHLRSHYLIFESNFDGDLDPYLEQMWREIPDTVNAVWEHCVGFPGTKSLEDFKAYMKKCQIETTFYFADVNDKTVQQTLLALQTQSAVAAFVEKNQGKPANVLQAAFKQFVKDLKSSPRPKPASRHGKEFADELT
jgi:hypothetical protein